MTFVDEMTPASPRTVEAPPLGPRRRWAALVVAFGAGWMALPWLTADDRAYDAVSFVGAAEVVGEDPSLLYPDEHGYAARELVVAACQGYPPGGRCPWVPPFVSSPPAAVAAAPLRHLEPRAAVLLIRCLSAASMVLLLVLCWRRFAMDPRGARYVAALAALLTPTAVGVVVLGQSTGFVAMVVFGGGAALLGQRRTGLLVAVTTVLKLFPVVFLALLLLDRRRVAAVWSLGGLAVAAAVGIVGTGIDTFASWAEAVGHHGDVVALSTWNSSLDRLVAGTSLGDLPAVAARVLIVVTAVIAFRRHASMEPRWAIVGTAMIVVSPQLWVHYLLVSVLACSLVVGDGRRWLVLVLAAACSAANWALSVREVTGDGLRLLTFGVAIGAFAATLLEVRRPAERAVSRAMLAG